MLQSSPVKNKCVINQKQKNKARQFSGLKNASNKALSKIQLNLEKLYIDLEMKYPNKGNLRHELN